MTNDYNSAAKSDSRPTLLAIIVLIIIVLIYLFCGRVPSEDSTTKGTLKIDKTIQAPHGIAFLDIKGDSIMVQKVKVYLIDPEGKVVSSNGVNFDSIEVTGGVMSVGLAPDAVFNNEKPYQYTIRAEAEGYFTNIKTIFLTKNVPGYYPIYMAKIDDLPSGGIAASEGTIQSLQNGIAMDDMVLQTQLVYGDKKFPFSITIENHTQFLFNGTEVKTAGPLHYKLLTCAPMDYYANRLFPGGFQISNGKDEKGNEITAKNPGYLTAAGWFTLELKIGNQEVNGFSKPLKVAMNFRDFVNTLPDYNLHSGDTIPLWSVDYNTGKWNSDTSIVVSSGLAVEYPVSHLSSWTLGTVGPVCQEDVMVTYRYDGSNMTGFSTTRMNNPGNFLGSLRDNASGQEIPLNTGNRLTFDETRTLFINRFPSNLKAQLFVSEDVPASQVPQRIGTTNEITCSTDCNFLARETAGSHVPSCAITYKFVEDGTTNKVVFSNNTIWYKENAVDPYFMFGGTVDNGGIAKLPSSPASRSLRLWFLGSDSTSEKYIEFKSINPAQSMQASFSLSPGWTIDNNPYIINYDVVGDITVPCDGVVITLHIPSYLLSGL